jgi:anionic cell wall polymer biosynthesis LytR-Cps2A-Psr (LCP) family protein
VTGDLPDGLGLALTDLYSWLLDPQNPAPRIPNGLAEHLESVPPAAAESIQATATTTELNRNGSVGVVRTDTGDVLLAADEGDGWQIVGIDPATGPPWFGDEPRMVLVMADQIRDTWDLDVEGYLITGFVGFEDLVAELGRLKIDLPQRVNSLKYWPGFPAGEQRLTPQRTLELARTRKGVPGGDFGRSANQGLVILAALDMIQTNDIDDAPALLDALLTHVWTDLPAGALIQLAATVFQMDSSEIENVVLPGKLGRAAGGASVVRLAPEADDMLADLGDDGLLTGP